MKSYFTSWLLFAIATLDAYTAYVYIDKWYGWLAIAACAGLASQANQMMRKAHEE